MQASYKHVCEVPASQTLLPASTNTWISSVQLTFIMFPDYYDSLPQLGAITLCRLNKAFYIRHQKVNRPQSSTQLVSYMGGCVPFVFAGFAYLETIKCLLTNASKCGNEQNFSGTEPPSPPPNNRRPLVSCMTLHFRSPGGSVAKGAQSRITASKLWCEKISNRSALKDDGKLYNGIDR